MVVRRQPLAIIHDENAEIKRGKPSIAKSGRLKAQQPDLADCRTLSNNTNKLKPLSSLGTATPNVPRKENNVHNNGKGEFTVMVDLEILEKSEFKAQGQSVPRTPLSNITNVDQSSSKAQATIKEKKAMRIGPNPRYEITKEMKQKAEMWAREGIEKVNFTRKDMEALQEKMVEEEVDRHVAQALSYHTEIPFLLSRAFVKVWSRRRCMWIMMNLIWSALKYCKMLPKIGLLLLKSVSIN